MTLPADDLNWLALVVWDEAQGETFLGQAAVASVVLKRKGLPYASDGTMRGTILAHFQFSGFYFEMEHGHYTQIAHDVPGAEVEAAKLYAAALPTKAYGACLAVAREVMAGTFKSSDPAWAKLSAEPRAILYFNPAISKPAWADPAKHICDIGHHAFYRG
jgi:hypothetical protein